MKRLSTGLMAVTMSLTLALAVPRPVQAGDKEWAAAGKILTGLVVLGAISSAVQPQPYVEQQTVYMDRTVYVDRPVYVERPSYAPPPAYTAPPARGMVRVVPPPPVQEQPIVVYQGVENVETPMVTYETRYFQGRRMEGCPRVSFRSANPPREIVMPYGYGRRLYQPGIRGHLSYVQEWSAQRGVWLSIGYHPCMWR